MNPDKPPPPRDTAEEVSALIATLHRTEQRLNELTAGEVDSVADQDGHSLLLRRPQEQLRASDAARRGIAEDNLRESERRFSAMLANVELASVMLDTEARITYCNDYLLRLTGWRLEEVVGRDWFEVFMPAELGDMKPVFAALLKNLPEAWHRDNEIFTRSGERRMIRWSNSVLRSGTGDVVGTASIGEDITEKKYAEEKQRAIGHLLDNIVENIPSAVQVKSAQGNFRIELWNKAAEEMYGVPSTEAIGKNVHDLWPEADADRMHAADVDLAATGRMQDFPNRLAKTRTRGDIRVHMRKIALLDTSGKATHLLVVADDITAQLADQARLRESEARFRSLTELSSDWFWEQDVEHRFVKFSGGEGVKGWGPDQEQAVGLHRWDLGGVIPISCNWEEHKRLLDSHESFRDFEYSRILGDGRLQFVEASGEPIFDTGGAFAGYRGVATEITERKLAEKSLERQQSELRALFDLIPAMVWFKDTNNGILRVNRRVAEAAGKTVAQIEGKPSLEIYPEDAARFYADDLEVMKSGVPKLAYVESLHGPAGEEIWVQTDKIPYFDHDGKVIGIVVMAQDITERKRSEQDLQRFRTAMDSSGDAIVLVDRTSMRYVDVNQTLCDLVGYTRQEVIGMTPMELFGTQRDALERDYDAIIADKSNKSIVVEGFYRHKDGSLIPIETRRRAMRTDEGWVIVGSARDITDRRLADNRIRHLNRVYAMLTAINSPGVRVSDRDHLFSEVCRIAVDKGGFHSAWIGVIDQGSERIVPVASAGADEGLLAAVRNLLASNDGMPQGNTLAAKTLRLKTAFVSNDSQNDPAVLFGRTHAQFNIQSMAMLPLIVADKSIAVLALYAREINFFSEEEMRLLTELAGDIAHAIDHIGKRDRLDYLAYYDELTGLANRALFLERVAQYMRSAVAGGHKLALFLIDLERFRNINDSLGRPAGDSLLQQVAVLLSQGIGDPGLLARVGADQFAVVLPELVEDGSVAHLTDKRIQGFLNHSFKLQDAEYRIAIKVGVALFPNDGIDAESLLKNAEVALKKAKLSGEKFLFYTQKMNEKLAGRLTLENQLRQALDNEEYVLHYQPKVGLADGKLMGAEALIRWNNPRTGLVPPGQFIPVLEETGLIYDVGRWALRQAIQDYLRWRAAGLPAVRIAVNVSPMQLRNRSFITEIEQVVGIDAGAAAGLELEITESLIMENVKRSIESLQAIRSMGVHVAIDDFGTGYSSLSHLAKLPVDTLKIDRSFVIDMMAGPNGLALVSTIINLAHSLKLNVVAEGVETEEQSRLLRLLKCDEMQGFLFSRPVPSSEFETRFLALPPIAVPA